MPGNPPVRSDRRRAERLFSRFAESVLRYRRPVKFLLHLAMFLCANYLAYVIRFDFRIPAQYDPVIRATIPVVLIAKALGFLSFGLFRGWWRYVSIQDVFPIVAGCTLGSVLFALGVFLLWGPFFIPRSIYLLDLGNMIMIALASRYLIRTGRERFGRQQGRTDRRILIVGAGAAGQMIAREVYENIHLGMSVAGFVDDDRQKIGARIQGVKVLGGHERIEEICREHEVDEIVIAIPSAPPVVVRHIVDHCRNLSARFRILPGVGQLIDGKVSVKALRDVNLADLLGRPAVRLDVELIRREITGRTVMVTGAAGSIGSELCRQVARHSPARLVLFEIAESPLFELEHDMRVAFPDLPLVPVIGDIRDRRRVEEIVAAHRPTVIYHAAAYKHVPVMEVNPAEAVKTNILGTRIVSDVAAEHGVRRFVLVSTDKAVRPTNVMGATKRVAELIVQRRNRKNGGTVFVAVRFGNVLDSAGSVIPIFRKQMETTGKLTVTHPEASRYFMLIPEAAGLILQAGAMGSGGEVFVLEMGEPVNIVDLARNLIRLSGKEEGVDAEIVFTGLRPGEKLHEELVLEGEDVVRTAHPKVMMMIGDAAVEPGWDRHFETLVEIALLHGNNLRIIRELDALVKGYTPDYTFHEKGTSAIPLPTSPSSKSIH